MLTFPIFQQISSAWYAFRTAPHGTPHPSADNRRPNRINFSDMDNFVTIATFDRATDAYIAQGRLAAEGIKAQLFGNHMMQMDCLYAFALSGIRLQVSRKDVATAERILTTDYSHDLDDVDVGKPEI